jgi:hypothetical protein
MLRVGTCLIALLFLVASAGYGNDHPAFYVDKGACPFECCTYREWHVEQTTRLYAEPKTDSTFVGVAEKGIFVKAETGEVHTTKPGKFIVRRNVPNFQEGDILWVYTYLGEGCFKIWYRGTFIEEEIGIDYRSPSPEDWGCFEIIPTSTWWVKVRTSKGIEGWTNQPENFSNKDACGQ